MKNAFYSLILIFLMTTIGAAQEKPGLKQIGAQLGYVHVESPIGSNLGIGLNIDFGSLAPGAFLNGYLDFWAKEYEKAPDWNSRWTHLGMGIIGKYYFELKQTEIKPYAGGGIRIHLSFQRNEFSKTEEKICYIKESTTDVDIGVTILGGAELRISPKIKAFLETRYTIDGADFWTISIGGWYNITK